MSQVDPKRVQHLTRRSYLQRRTHFEKCFKYHYSYSVEASIVGEASELKVFALLLRCLNCKEHRMLLLHSMIQQGCSFKRFKSHSPKKQNGTARLQSWYYYSWWDAFAYPLSTCRVSFSPFLLMLFFPLQFMKDVVDNILHNRLSSPSTLPQFLTAIPPL